MPTFNDPLVDAAEASEALRGLAHASRVFDDPADTYAVFGDLTAGVRSLRQILDQLAAAHLAHRDRAQAHHDGGDHIAGMVSVLAAADELHHAGTLLDQAYDRLDAAFSHSGRIAWHPEPSPERTTSREQLAARRDLDHPGSTPENEGLFPGWVADAARTNTDDLAMLAEPDTHKPAAGRRWFSVVFLQGEDADRVLDVIDRDGTDAVIGELAGYDYGYETQQAALENGYVYDDQPPAGGTDRTATADGYALTYNRALGHVGLYRQLDPLPDAALLDINTPTPVAISAEQADRALAPQGDTARGAALDADRDWFAGSARSSDSAERGLSL